MANTDYFGSLPSTEAGLSIRSSNSGAWVYSDWYIIDRSTGWDISIYGLAFQPTFVMSADISYEFILEIGEGNPGTTIIQVPYSMRNDTAVGFYNGEEMIFLPEPVFIPQSTMLSVRIASHINGQYFSLNGFKILYQGTKDISTPPTSFNNYTRFMSGGSTSIGGVI